MVEAPAGIAEPRREARLLLAAATGLSQAQLVEIGHRHVAVESFSLVHRQEQRLAAAARELRDELIPRRDAGSAVHQHDQTIRFTDGAFSLRNHQAFDHVRILDEAAGIDHDAWDLRSSCESVLAIAREAGQIGYQRISSTGHGIEQG